MVVHFDPRERAEGLPTDPQDTQDVSTGAVTEEDTDFDEDMADEELTEDDVTEDEE